MARPAKQQQVKGSLPHIEWIDLHQDGLMHEVAVVKRDRLGNVHIIKVADLDTVDRTRLASILRNRNATAFELWDLLSQHTLGNGMNALDYFHQLVKMVTPNGQILQPDISRVGYQRQSLTPAPKNAKV